MKAKIFIWCTLANKIPTWDHLQRRQIIGPGWCSLCKDNEESTNHLFLSCNFSNQVWEHSQSLTSSRSNWECPTLEDAWKDWSSSPQTNQIRTLLLLHMWGIWLARNKAIFLEEAISLEEVARQGLDILSYFPRTKNNPNPRIIIPEQMDKNTPWDFFDGASQDLKCGGGATLFLNPTYHFQIPMGLGSRSNNYAELMALKLLLCFQLKENAKNYKYLVTLWL